MNRPPRPDEFPVLVRAPPTQPTSPSSFCLDQRRFLFRVRPYLNAELWTEVNIRTDGGEDLRRRRENLRMGEKEEGEEEEEEKEEEEKEEEEEEEEEEESGG